MNKFAASFLLAALLSLSAQAQSLKDAFIDITENNLKKQYKYLAITPLEAPEALRLPDAVKTTIETEITAALEKEGFKILPVSAMQDIRNHMSSLVGTADATGKQAAVLDHSYRELLLRNEIDAVVGLRIELVGAPFTNDKAEWHGTSQSIKNSGDGLVKFITGQKYTGSIAASSLKVTIWDRKETLLYSWAGGIEVLMQREGQSLKYMPEDQFWQDERRIKNAIKAALQPF